MLSISDNLFLVHAAMTGEGKTRGMARGMLLCRGNERFAGESAGFGLPVIKTGKQTVFPSLFSSRQTTGNAIEAVYKLDRVINWRVMGIGIPSILSLLSEAAVGVYMKRQRDQQWLLKVRDKLFFLFRIDCAMTPGRSRGYGRVRYVSGRRRLTVAVDATALAGAGELIMLNEVPGTHFTRFRTPRTVFDGIEIPAWCTWPPGTVVENPAAHIGFSVSLPAGGAASGLTVSGGREVARGLDWAGISLGACPGRFTYDVNFDEGLP